MSSLIPLLALLSIGGWPTTFPHLRIALSIDAKLPAAVARGAVEEAAVVWAPYGVAIGLLDASPIAGRSGDRAADAALTVVVAEPSPDTALVWSSPFGSIRFRPDGEPEPTILLHYDAVIKLGLRAISLNGARGPQWPESVRNQALARIVGRVVAHEIGHWLLRSRTHSTSGLMRARQNTDELVDPGRGGFALTRAEIARLRTLVAP
jgi:hypothetical protein